MDEKEYQEWAEKVEEIKNSNKPLLNDFEKWLSKKNLKPKTIKNHLFNIDFYINKFLLHYEATPPEEGTIRIGAFLGNYFIWKTTWASKYTIKANIASLKKFYTFMKELGKIDDDNLQEMKEVIKDEKKFWLKEIINHWNDLEDDW